MERYWARNRVVASSAHVWNGIDQETGEEIVMKLAEIEHDSNYADSNERAKLEAQIMKELSLLNPARIVQFKAFYVNRENQYVLVMEKAECTVHDVMQVRMKLSEHEVKVVIHGILEGLISCHRKYIVHRDLKPENLFLFNNNLNSVKLGDFGISAEDNGYSCVGGIKGTKGYMAPEILKKQLYGRPVDMWAVGVIAYELLFGSLPFPASTSKPKIFGNNKPIYPKLAFPLSVNVSATAKSFIQSLLVEDPDIRLTAAQAIAHEWLQTLQIENTSAPPSAKFAPDPPIVAEPVHGFPGWLRLVKGREPAYFFHQPSNVTQWHHPEEDPLPLYTPVVTSNVNLETATSSPEYNRGNRNGSVSRSNTDNRERRRSSADRPPIRGFSNPEVVSPSSRRNDPNQRGNALKPVVTPKESSDESEGEPLETRSKAKTPQDVTSASALEDSAVKAKPFKSVSFAVEETEIPVRTTPTSQRTVQSSESQRVQPNSDVLSVDVEGSAQRKATGIATTVFASPPTSPPISPTLQSSSFSSKTALPLPPMTAPPSRTNSVSRVPLNPSPSPILPATRLVFRGPSRKSSKNSTASENSLNSAMIDDVTLTRISVNRRVKEFQDPHSDFRFAVNSIVWTPAGARTGTAMAAPSPFGSLSSNALCERAIAAPTPHERAFAFRGIAALNVQTAGLSTLWLKQTLSKSALPRGPSAGPPVSATCGVFVHGCEDEFEVVRIAAIDALCELSLQSQPFATSAFDFLVDMFNDEMQRVRLTAIRNLKRIALRFQLTLNENQLHTVLLALDDLDPNMRLAGYELLGVKAFVSDELKDRLLNLDKRYLPKEVDLDNVKHITYLILIFNAGFTDPTILQNMPQYTFKQVYFLNAKYPQCFQGDNELDPVTKFHPENIRFLMNSWISVQQDVFDLLALNKHDFAINQLTNLHREVRQVCRLEKGLDLGIFVKYLLEVFKNVLQIQRTAVGRPSSVGAKMRDLVPLTQELFRACWVLSHSAFTGVSPSVLAGLQGARLFAEAAAAVSAEDAPDARARALLVAKKILAREQLDPGAMDLDDARVADPADADAVLPKFLREFRLDRMEIPPAVKNFRGTVTCTVSSGLPVTHECAEYIPVPVLFEGSLENFVGYHMNVACVVELSNGTKTVVPVKKTAIEPCGHFNARFSFSKALVLGDAKTLRCTVVNGVEASDDDMWLLADGVRAVKDGSLWFLV
ncbi:hypothetical protein HDU83_008722 [Entophlyctis luteolus]|nr:hypothetical protein HDU83_008722 [Entophlyctis luteolus]